MEIKYCRREKIAGTPCGNAITKSNSLNWCNGCRVRLPLWPRIEDGNLTKEVPADSERGAALIAACMAVDMTGALEEVRAMKPKKVALSYSGQELEMFGDAVLAGVRS